MIREEEPPQALMRLEHARASESTDRRKRGGSTCATLRRQLRGDLDWITMKALEKDRTRRYGSPPELAADIERHLRNEPVLAGPPSDGVPGPEVRAAAPGRVWRRGGGASWSWSASR